MTDHTDLLNDVPPSHHTNGAAADPPRQLLADQTPFLSAAHLASRRAADQAMFAAHPGAYVAFVDTWAGSTLSREVVVAAPDVAAFYDAMDALPQAVRRRCEVNRIPDPEAFHCSLFFPE